VQYHADWQRLHHIEVDLEHTVEGWLIREAEFSKCIDIPILDVERGSQAVCRQNRSEDENSENHE